MKIAILIALIVLLLVIVVAHLLSFILLTLAKAVENEYYDNQKEPSRRDLLELENTEFNYGHDVERETYGE